MSRGGGGAGRYQGQDGDSTFLRLADRVQTNTFTIQRNVANVEKMIALIGTPRENPRTQQQMNAALEEAKNLIKDNTNLLKELNHLDGATPAEQRDRNLQQRKLRDDLDMVATSFKEVYKKAVKKEQDQLNRERAASVRQAAGGYDKREEKQSLLDDSYDQRQQLAQEVQVNTALIEERAQGMRELEAQMVDINEIFKDIATMVHEQGDMLDSIESNLTTASDRVDEGTTQLTHASRYQKKARNKAFCLLVIVVIVGAILAIVLVTSLGHKKK